MPTATFKITPAAPGKTEHLTATEDTERRAINVGLVHTMQTVGWLAFVYGSVEVLHVESGNTWTVNCDRKDPK